MSTELDRAVSTPLELPYMPQLDSLRAYAVGTVMLTHLYGLKRLPLGLGRLDIFAAGVPLFFVLSGFLITTILLRYRETAEANGHRLMPYLRFFYIRRALRIFPLYYLVVFVAFAVNIPPVRETIFWLLAYMSNYYMAFYQHGMGLMGHFWSLAVEEQFYLVWPWLVLFLPHRRLLLATVGLIICAPLYRLYVVLAYPADLWFDHFLMTPTPARLDMLGGGALLALMLYTAAEGRRIYRALSWLVLPAGVLTMLALDRLNTGPFGTAVSVILRDSALAAVLCWLVAAASRGFPGWIGRLLELRPLIYLGKISYGLYVYHNFMPLLLATVMGWVGLSYPGQGARGFVLSSMATLVVAMLSWHLLERPINRLKARVPLQPTPLGTARPAEVGR